MEKKGLVKKISGILSGLTKSAYDNYVVGLRNFLKCSLFVDRDEEGRICAVYADDTDRKSMRRIYDRVLMRHTSYNQFQNI